VLINIKNKNHTWSIIVFIIRGTSMKIIKSTLIIVLLASGSVYAKDTNMEQRRIPVGEVIVTVDSGREKSRIAALPARNPGGEVIVTLGSRLEQPLSSSCKSSPGGCPILQ
jgi:hypothetical protein